LKKSSPPLHRNKSTPQMAISHGVVGRLLI
jgi:hypothetical protein